MKNLDSTKYAGILDSLSHKLRLSFTMGLHNKERRSLTSFLNDYQFNNLLIAVWEVVKGIRR